MLEKRIPTVDTLNAEFTLFELKRALKGAKNTSSGRNGICYIMIKNLSLILEYNFKIV